MATNPKNVEAEKAKGAVREVARKVRGMPTSDGAGVRLTRVIGQPALDSFDPFLLLDELRSDDANDYIEGFPEPPAPRLRDRDVHARRPNAPRRQPGQLGVARPRRGPVDDGRQGLVHSEIPEQKDGLMWGFQLWVNLPAKDKLMKPRYQDIQGDKVPEVDLGPGARARVLVGTVNGVKGPVMEVATDPLYFDLLLDANASYTATLPEGHNAFAYVYQGDAKIGAAGTAIKAQEMALLTRGASLPVTAGADGARLIVVAGRPLGEPVARYGPFVMNTAEEIHQAFADYQAGRL